ncbi:YebY family protein [Providencia rustigianii]|uniref:YebY family protein n=1 Tax=Providencia rustigianii TaxID=158850 RepID=UPI00224054A6|nr:YebY family protein [Providencia rustigianii]
MKHTLIVCSLLLSGTVSSAFAAPLTSVSKKQFGADWPLKREEVMLECRSNGALIVINPSTLMQYPLNDIAQDLMEKKQIQAQPIDVLLEASDSKKTTEERILPLKQAAQKLCE